MPVAISSRTADVLTSFQDLVAELERATLNDLLRKVPSLVVENEARFKIWAGNAGAYREPEHPFSLETRLHNAPEITDRILTLLASLTEVNKSTISIVSGKEVNRTVTYEDVQQAERELQSEGENPARGEEHDILDDEEGIDSIDNPSPYGAADEASKSLSEAAELCRRSAAIITTLLRISAFIRGANPRDRWARATAWDRGKTIAEYGAFDEQLVKTEFPKCDSPYLLTRLAKVVTARRQFLKYIERRHKVTAHEQELQRAEVSQEAQPSSNTKVVIGNAAAPPALSVGLSRPYSKASTLRIDEAHIQHLDRIMEQPEDREIHIRDNVTNYKSSMAGSDVLDQYGLGDLIKMSKTTDQVECPYCFGMQDSMRSKHQWRQHIFSDLRAYVCTYEDCDAKPFELAETWFQHEMTAHRREWICLFCSQPTFSTAKAFEHHLRSSHAAMCSSDDVLASLISASSRTMTDIEASDCPLCKSDYEQSIRREALEKRQEIPDANQVTVPVQQMRSHIERHLEQLALRTFAEDGPDSGTRQQDPELKQLAVDRTHMWHRMVTQLAAQNLVQTPGEQGRQLKAHVTIMGSECSSIRAFIDTLTGAPAEIRQKMAITDAEPYEIELEEYQISLIALPSLENRAQSERNSVEQIASWLDLTFRHPPHVKQTAVIYLQPIVADDRLIETARGLQLLQLLVGAEAFQNISIVTTGWNGNHELPAGIAKEVELINNSRTMRLMIDHGCRTARFDGTQRSAVDIINSLLNNVPCTLKIQEELVNQNKSLEYTDVGRMLVIERDQAERGEQRLATAEARRERRLEIRSVETPAEIAPTHAERLEPQTKPEPLLLVDEAWRQDSERGPVDPLPPKRAGSGPRHLIVGIDYGTTHTGVGYVFSDESFNDITIIRSWPGKYGEWKTPSRIAYKQENADFNLTGNAWGFQVEPTMLSCSWTKLLLRSDAAEIREVHEKSKITQALDEGYLRVPVEVSPWQVCGDFLAELHAYILAHLSKKLSPETMSTTPVEYWFTVPAFWSHKARSSFAAAAREAGYSRRWQDSLQLVSEPDAAAVASFSRYTQPDSSFRIEQGQLIMICGCGGGTTDLMTCEIIATEPSLQFREAVVSANLLCGGVNTDLNLHGLMNKRFGSAFDKIQMRRKGPGSRFMNSWESVKRSFTSQNRGTFEIGPLRMTGVESGEYYDEEDCMVILSHDDIKGLFDPVVDQIVTLILAQKDAVELRAGRRIKAILLVGGLGDSDYLYDEIRRSFWLSGIQVFCPEHPQAAMTQGAVMCGLQPQGRSVNTPQKQAPSERRLRASYGIGIVSPFREGIDPPGKGFGEVISNNTRRTVSISTRLLDDKIGNQQSCRVYCSSQGVPPDYTDSPDVSEVGVINVNIDGIDKSRLPHKRDGLFGKKRWNLEYEVVMTFSSDDEVMAVQAKWKNVVFGVARLRW